MADLPGIERPELQMLPRIADRMSFLYFEHCKLNRKDGAITVTDEKGVTYVPAASISVLMLGPGTSITHRAMELIGDAGVSVVWVGEQGVRYYAGGRALTSRLGLLLKQAKMVSNQRLHLNVVKKMYQLRFPDESVAGLTLQQLRGRVCKNLKNGRATMVYNTQGEQKMNFQVHNSAWVPVDFDGIKLMRHPAVGTQSNDTGLKEGFSKAAKWEKSRKSTANCKGNKSLKKYTVIDIETTGLSFTEDRIIEVTALHVSGGKVTDQYCGMISSEKPLPESVVNLTGITDDLLNSEGKPLDLVLERFIDFILGDSIVCYNASFDLNFIQEACGELNIVIPRDIKIIDTLKLARQKIKGAPDYKLETMAQYFEIDTSGIHRARKDCYLTCELYEKLIKM